MSKPIMYTIHWSQFIFSAVIALVVFAIIILSIVSSNNSNKTNSNISNNLTCSTSSPESSNSTTPSSPNYISNCKKWLMIESSNMIPDIILGKSLTLIKCQELCEQDHVCLRHGFVFDEGNLICYYNKESPQYFNNPLNTTKFFFCVIDECKNNPCQNNATCVEKDIQYFCNCRELDKMGENCSDILDTPKITAIQPDTVYRDNFMSSYNQCLDYVVFYKGLFSSYTFSKYSDIDNYCLIYDNGVLKSLELIKSS